MRRYHLAILALAYAGWLLWAGWQVTRAEQVRNVEIEYQERGGLTAREYWELTTSDEAEDEGLDSLQIEAKYFNGGGK